MTNIYFESVLMAWSSIVSNKMRSLLTMLGIIIGVAAVIALMSIGYGVQDSIKSDISRLGSNTITVTPGTGRKPGVKQAAGSMQTLTYKDYLAIRNLPCPCRCHRENGRDRALRRRGSHRKEGPYPWESIHRDRAFRGKGLLLHGSG